MRGSGVSASAANPTVVSKNVTSGAGNVVVSAAQTIENGQTITFKGSSRTATITGDVTVSSHGSDNLTLTLELDNILTVG